MKTQLKLIVQMKVLTGDSNSNDWDKITAGEAGITSLNENNEITSASITIYNVDCGQYYCQNGFPEVEIHEILHTFWNWTYHRKTEYNESNKLWRCEYFRFRNNKLPNKNIFKR